MKKLSLNLAALIMLSLMFFAFDTNAQVYHLNGAVNTTATSSDYTGIRQASPAAHLHVGSFFTVNSNSSGYTSIGQNYKWHSGAKKIESTKGTVRMLFHPDGHLMVATAAKGGGTTLNGTNFTNKFILRNTGLTLIGENAHQLTSKIGGTMNEDDYRLIVGTGILTEKVKVALSTTADWADYVFEEDYDLNEIEEVEAFVKENKHLPNIPSAKEVVENGLNVAEMDAKLLRQIEELWLQMIELNKEVKGLKTENAALKGGSNPK